MADSTQWFSQLRKGLLKRVVISYKWYPKMKLKERTDFQRRIQGSSVSVIRRGASVEASRGPEERHVKLAAFRGISL